MHYIGMNALHASAHMEHDPTLVAASVAIAIGASALALWLAGRRRRPSLLISAIAFGTAIAGMHYTAMAGLTIFPHVTPMSRAPALSSDLLAIVVAIVAFLMSAIFLLLLVPERQAVDTRADTSDTTDLRDAATQIGVAPPMGVSSRSASLSLACLPIEREGITQFIAVDDIVAVHANAHYTYIFDGTSKLFCSLPISDVEARLDHRRFVRVHRSHIVNMDRVVGLKRAGDNGVIELAAIDRYTVPVSRGRLGNLRSRLSLRPGDAIRTAAASPGTAA
jgi:DNA-binding LytR/AlgR family response regulator